jgi:uncharacterized membrane protein
LGVWCIIGRYDEQQQKTKRPSVVGVVIVVVIVVVLFLFVDERKNGSRNSVVRHSIPADDV